MNWTQKDFDKLKDLYDLGNTARDIFNMGIFNCSKNAIQKKMTRLGLSKQTNTIKFIDEIEDKFKKFLLSNWKGKTPRELCEVWNKENGKYPVNVMRVSSYLDKLGVLIPYEEIQKINNLKIVEKELNLSNKHSAAVLIEKIRLERVKLMQGRLEENKDIWSGLPMPCVDLNA